jgi:hypothetical protein
MAKRKAAAKRTLVDPKRGGTRFVRRKTSGQLARVIRSAGPCRPTVERRPRPRRSAGRATRAIDSRTVYDKARPEFRVLRRLRLALPKTPLLVFADRAPSEGELNLVKRNDVTLVRPSSLRATRLAMALDQAINPRRS